MTAEIEKIILEHKNIFIINTDNRDLEPSVLRDFCRQNDVHIYCEKDAVVFANSSYLFIHTPEQDNYQLNMPGHMKLNQIFGDKADPTCDILQKHCGYLYEITRP